MFALDVGDAEGEASVVALVVADVASELEEAGAEDSEEPPQAVNASKKREAKARKVFFMVS
ncbi:hypothetical protein [Rothia nasisuis]|uniref:hypothetical protein n=1 Tax=Rothia nasisuis TaxID=2109647 RepID=UPI001F192BB7|nr:hypothetical protein [Rothia nasisuis]